MHLWLLCCVLLFITSQGYDWISHQAWFGTPELALPWVVLGGIGLAIASNPSVFQHQSTPPSSTQAPDAPQYPLPTSRAAEFHPPPVTAAEHPLPVKPVSTKKAAISFEISQKKTRSPSPKPNRQR